jgi:hypothetical protein
MVKDDGVIRTGAGGPADPYRYCINPIIEAVTRAQERHRAEHLGEVDAPNEQERGRGKISDPSTFHVQRL